MSTPLVLVPGLNCTARLFASQIEAFAGERPTLVADVRGASSMTAMAERVLALAPPRFALAGLSMGGYAAFEIMRRAPGRVERLALLDTSARPDAPERVSFRRQQIEKARGGRFREIVEGSWPMLVHPARFEDAALFAVHAAMCEATGPDAYVGEVEAVIGRPDSRPELASIAVPTLVLVGEQDALTPLEASKEMAEAIPGARLEVVPHCGHLSTLEMPGRVVAALRAWLA
jgi:pimeloyl-ACP methyl ester carboxylesterase